MEKDKLPTIPTPVAQRWREFRIQVVPFIVFLSVISGIVYLWRTYVQPVGVIGAVETNTVNVTSLQDGIIQDLFVERFQNVVTGQVIAIVVNTDPELIKAQIAAVQGDLEVLRDRMKIDKVRTDQNWYQLKQEPQIQRVQLTIDRANLIVASNDYVRATAEFKDKLISEAQFDSARGKFEATLASIQERTTLIDQQEKGILQLTPVGPADSDSIDSTIEAKRKELELMLRPTTLKAPISGMISMVHHFPNERIIRGMPIVSISDPECKRIVGYVRQPVTDVPTTNDFVRIVTRSQPRQQGRGQVLRVGAQMELINPVLLSPDTKRLEIGLPILVSVPAGIRLVPGEHVNLYIEYAKP